MTRNKKIGVLCIILPFALLFLVLSAYAIASFVITQLLAESTIATSTLQGPDIRTTIGSLIRVILGFAGVLSVIGIFVLVPLGIYFLNKKDVDEVVTLQTNPKYQNLTPEQIQFITKWSWGAFFGGLIWPLGNKLYLWALASIIPLVNIYVWIRLSIDGRKMAWEKGGWENFDQFKNRQAIMGWIILAFIIFSFVIRVLNIALEYSSR